MTYQQKKEQVRNEAIDWQYEQADMSLSYGELADAQERFERLGRRYGLLQEFRENAIC
jgi:outer membrane protein assembly factor BamD (BamD/ComL family)